MMEDAADMEQTREEPPAPSGASGSRRGVREGSPRGLEHRIGSDQTVAVVGIVGIMLTIIGTGLALAVFLNAGIAALGTRIDGLDERLRLLEEDVAVLKVEVRELGEDVDAIRDRIEDAAD